MNEDLATTPPLPHSSSQEEPSTIDMLLQASLGTTTTSTNTAVPTAITNINSSSDTTVQSEPSFLPTSSVPPPVHPKHPAVPETDNATSVSDSVDGTATITRANVSKGSASAVDTTVTMGGPPMSLQLTTVGKEEDGHTHMLDCAPAPGWTVHVNTSGRLYYCNHVTRTAGWLPPAEAWKPGEDGLPYGWERGLDDSGRPYYINHVNKTTTYETPMVRCLEPMETPTPRTVTLERSATLGFGFVAGSEKPVIVRFVTEGGPSVEKLQPGDQILYVNGEDVKSAPREHVISLVRACAVQVNLVVCQPVEQQGARKSTLLSASKRARLRNKPSRVRFAESVCVNGAPLFPPSAFSLGDLCVPPMANVLKVFLENGQTKSFKYDAWTSVQDVVTALEAKLCLTATEHFSLVVEHIKSLKRNKLTLLDGTDTLARIASRPGAHKLRCLYRVSFVPTSAAALAQADLSALDYLYTQCCNDVIQERFAPELQYDTALRLAALHVYQHALANNMPSGKLTVKTIEREFGLERFVPASLLEKMKRKEVRKLIAHFLKLHASMAGPGKQLTALQAKLHYLDIVSQLPSYGAKCFSAGPKADVLERVILVSPKFGISEMSGSRTAIPVPIATLDSMKLIEVTSDDELNRTVTIRLQNDLLIKVSLEERDANELVLVLKGYYKLLTGQTLSVEKEETEPIEDLAPPYLSQHKVLPEKWSYINQQQVKTSCFALPPLYHPPTRKTNGLYNTMGRPSLCSKPPLGHLGFSLDSNMNTSSANNKNVMTLLRHQQTIGGGAAKYDLQRVGESEGVVEARNEDVLRRVQEVREMVQRSQDYLSEHQRMDRLNSSSEWQESSVDIESDNDSILPDDPLLHKIRHSDSLTLLHLAHHTTDAKNDQLDQDNDNDSINSDRPPTIAGANGCNGNSIGNGAAIGKGFSNAAVEMLRYEMALSESDNDSVSTPRGSPKHANGKTDTSTRGCRISFGLHSPDTPHQSTTQELRTYLYQLRTSHNANPLSIPSNNNTQVQPTTITNGQTNSSPTIMHNTVLSNGATAGSGSSSSGSGSGGSDTSASVVSGGEDPLYCFDPELIDLRLLPPPATPDELDGSVVMGSVSSDGKCALVVPVVNVPPMSFADSVEKLNKLGVLHENLDLEEFLASVIVPSPNQKVTPAVELTPEEIMSFIIPPPPGGTTGPRLSIPNNIINNNANSDVDRKRRNSNESVGVTSNNIIEYATVDRKGAFSCCAKTREKPSNKDPDLQPFALKPPPRRSSDETPPERPPKMSPQERQRSQSLTSNIPPNKSGLNLPPKHSSVELSPPKLPPRGEVQPHLLLLPPKKPPLPPVPPLDVLRSRKNSNTFNKPHNGGACAGGIGVNGNELVMKTAGIGSPHLQRSRNMYSDLDTGFGRKGEEQEGTKEGIKHVAAAVSTPTSPFLGRGAQLSTAPIPSSPDKPPISPSYALYTNTNTLHRHYSHDSPTPFKRTTTNTNTSSQQHTRSHSESTLPRNIRFRDMQPIHMSAHNSPVHQQHRIISNNGVNSANGSPAHRAGVGVGPNGVCLSNREHLLAKTDVAMSSLLVRLDQVATQCTAAQEHGGGRLMCEEKFQTAKEDITTQSLQLVHSSKMLVIAMSEPTLPDLPENLAVCLTILRRLTELCQDLANHTTSPLQTRNLVIKVHDVTAAFRHLVAGNIDRSSPAAIEEHLAAEAESLASVLTTLLRSLRVFSP